MKMRVLRAFLLCAGMLAGWALPAHAQAIGSIFGKVTDTSGAVLPGVTVTVTGSGLQTPLVAVSGTSGAYQFPSVPVGTYTVTFELATFKKGVREGVIISSGFNAQIDSKLEIGAMTEEVTVSALSPVVDTKRTSTTRTFTAEVLEKIPTARDPWQVINMTPGVQAGLNVGGSSSGQQVSLTSRGTTANVQWNLEGGSITDLASNASPQYYNFDSFAEIQVTNGGGDVSVQSSGLSINLVTKSGSNVFKGSGNMTYENGAMQVNNVTQEQFNSGANGFLSGAPIKEVGNYSLEYGGPILKNKFWFWGAADYQGITIGNVNVFDPASSNQFCKDLITAQKAGSTALKGLATYDKIDDVNNCLKDDTTKIKDIQWKLNYSINPAHKIQWSQTSNNKYRNSRCGNGSCTATTLVEASWQQFNHFGFLGLPGPSNQITHTWVANDKLVFNNQMTYVQNGFFLDYEDVPPQGNCDATTYTGSKDPYTRPDGCLFNIQPLVNRTTGVTGRSATVAESIYRPTLELKTDGTYFRSHLLGGDHSLKFGLGYRNSGQQTFSHYAGGIRATVQCVGNATANCGDGKYVPAGAASGITAFQAVAYRDQLINTLWWSWSGYVQDSYSVGRWRVNGGLRYDWQQSKTKAGCVPANNVMPTVLPAQCEDGTSVDPVTGQPIPAFGNWSPRVSVTRDLFGNGKTQVHATGSYYYQTRFVLANNLTGLFSQPALTWGPNLSSGACGTATGCWQDTNLDGFVQPNELIGNPTSGNTRFNVNTGVFAPAGNTIDPSTKIARTREFVGGIQHELIGNLAVGVDFIYRKYDRGTTNYTIGYTPGPGYDALRALYVPASYTDPVTGNSATYYYIPSGSRPSGIGNITLTNPEYQIYKGVDITMNKRFSHRWQGAVGWTIQDNPNYFPYGSTTFINPTGYEFRNGVSTIAKYLFKAQGSYTLKGDVNVSGNFNYNNGATRTLSINGPGAVPGGTTGNLTYNTLEFTARDDYRFDPAALLDLNVSKRIKFRGGKNIVQVGMDIFNVLNDNTIQSYSASNQSIPATYNSPTSLVPPRVFRFDLKVNF
jgi:hypothetical protein